MSNAYTAQVGADNNYVYFRGDVIKNTNFAIGDSRRYFNNTTEINPRINEDIADYVRKVYAIKRISF